MLINEKYRGRHKLLIMVVLSLVFANILNAQQQTDTLTVFFEIDRAIVDETNAEALDRLINNENIVSISIYGYTDFLGSEEYNRLLSEKRSDNVCNYLISTGINSEQIVINEGKGIHPNSSVENRNDLTDRGIKDHRIVMVVYTIEVQNINIPENETNTDDDADGDGDLFSGEHDLSIITELTEENLVQDNIIVMNKVFFAYNTYEFHYMAYPALVELLETMRKYATLKIEVHGHICCFNDAERTDVMTLEGVPLSIGRAKAVHDFLLANGIDSSRLSYQGFGNTRRRYPLEQNEYERAMNRRVEILIVER